MSQSLYRPSLTPAEDAALARLIASLPPETSHAQVARLAMPILGRAVHYTTVARRRRALGEVPRKPGLTPVEDAALVRLIASLPLETSHATVARLAVPILGRSVHRITVARRRLALGEPPRKIGRPRRADLDAFLAEHSHLDDASAARELHRQSGRSIDPAVIRRARLLRGLPRPRVRATATPKGLSIWEEIREANRREAARPKAKGA